LLVPDLVSEPVEHDMAVAEFANALERTEEIELTTVGRVSGRKISHPVWFVKEGDTLYLLPVKGSDSQWYKNVLKNPTIELSVEGTRARARGIPITDPGEVPQVIERFRAKYGSSEVAKYYSKLDATVRAPLAA